MEHKLDRHTFYTPELPASNQQLRMGHRCTVGSQLEVTCPSCDSLWARMWAMVIVQVFYGPDVFGWFPIRGDMSFVQFVLSESERWSLRKSFVGLIGWVYDICRLSVCHSHVQMPIDRSNQLKWRWHAPTSKIGPGYLEMARTMDQDVRNMKAAWLMCDCGSTILFGKVFIMLQLGLNSHVLPQPSMFHGPVLITHDRNSRECRAYGPAG